MADETMTLEQVRDQIKAFATASYRIDTNTYVQMNVIVMDDWWKCIDAHIANQPKWLAIDALKRDAERLDWLESEANTLRCMEDGESIYFEVVSHHMAVPSERVEGIGKTPRQAIDAAMAAGNRNAP